MWSHLNIQKKSKCYLKPSIWILTIVSALSWLCTENIINSKPILNGIYFRNCNILHVITHHIGQHISCLWSKTFIFVIWHCKHITKFELSTQAHFVAFEVKLPVILLNIHSCSTVSFICSFPLWEGHFWVKIQRGLFHIAEVFLMA